MHNIQTQSAMGQGGVVIHDFPFQGTLFSTSNFFPVLSVITS